MARKNRNDRRAPARTLLERAVALHEAKPVHSFGGRHYVGAEAYGECIKALETTGGPADLVLDEVVRGRAAAAAFCEAAALPSATFGGRELS
ncbi:MAG: hypothetical protein GXY85_01975 [Candidatus Brocadiaceae bacterium]|nr:hypothetical protein [Candidatus Brocadiaceae bacterium]